MSLARALSPNQTPGVEMESTEVATPVRSISSMDCCGVQLNSCGKPTAVALISAFASCW